MDPLVQIVYNQCRARRRRDLHPVRDLCHEHQASQGGVRKSLEVMAPGGGGSLGL